MTTEEFNEWSEFHRCIFVLRSDGDVALVASWWGSLSTFSSSDLWAASRHMAENAPPSYRDKHLHALLDAVWKRQAQRQQREFDAELTEATTCKMCRGLGSLVVPHIRYVVDGEWRRDGRTWHEMSVACRCYRGQIVGAREQQYFAKKYEDNASKTPTVWVLDAYEMRVPHWEELVARRNAALKAEREARSQARHLDKKHGPLSVEGIAGRLAQQMDARRR